MVRAHTRAFLKVQSRLTGCTKRQGPWLGARRPIGSVPLHQPRGPAPRAVSRRPSACPPLPRRSPPGGRRPPGGARTPCSLTSCGASPRGSPGGVAGKQTEAAARPGARLRARGVLSFHPRGDRGRQGPAPPPGPVHRPKAPAGRPRPCPPPAGASPRPLAHRAATTPPGGTARPAPAPAPASGPRRRRRVQAAPGRTDGRRARTVCACAGPATASAPGSASQRACARPISGSAPAAAPAQFAGASRAPAAPPAEGAGTHLPEALAAAPRGRRPRVPCGPNAPASRSRAVRACTGSVGVRPGIAVTGGRSVRRSRACGPGGARRGGRGGQGRKLRGDLRRQRVLWNRLENRAP